MDIVELKGQYTRSQYEDMKVLMDQLTPGTVLSEETLRGVIADPASHLYVMTEGERVVATGTMCLYRAPYAMHAAIEDVVVLEEYRGRGLGRAMLQHILSEAAAHSPIEVSLTSKPSRIAANALYRALGFVQKDTNCYRLGL